MLFAPFFNEFAVQAARRVEKAVADVEVLLDNLEACRGTSRRLAKVTTREEGEGGEEERSCGGKMKRKKTPVFSGVWDEGGGGRGSDS